MNKYTSLGVTLCVSLGGLTISLLKRTDFLMYVILIALSVVSMLFYSLILRRGALPEKAFRGSKYMLAISAVISSATSVALACSLITDTAVMHKSFLPQLVAITILFSLAIAISKDSAASKSAVVLSFFAVGVLAILMLLCFVETDFSPITAGSLNIHLLLPLSAFSIFDIVFILPLINKNDGSMLLLGNTLSQIYMTALTLVAVSVLSGALFNSAQMPLMRLWQSTYIASFLSRFEIVAICAFFILCAFKSGLVLKYSFNAFGKTCAVWIVILLITCCIGILLYSGLVYLSAILSCISGVILPLISLLRIKRY